MEPSTRFSDLHAYLQGALTRVQIVIATNAFLLSAAAQMLQIVPAPLERLPTLVTLLGVSSVAALVYSLYRAAIGAGLDPTVRHRLVTRLLAATPRLPQDNPTLVRDFDYVGPDLHRQLIMEFHSKHQTIRYARLYLSLGIRGLILYAGILLMIFVLVRISPAIPATVLDWTRAWIGGLPVPAGLSRPLPFVTSAASVIALVLLALRWRKESSWSRQDMFQEAQLLPRA